ncbi:MAG: CoA transferase, partial [Chloroflexota bacterium]
MSTRADSKGPLYGIRVLDVTQALAGPYATMLLGDLGADVIRVESENSRPKLPEVRPNFRGESTIFLSANRNKRSLVLNLRTRQGKGVFYDLVRIADVVMDNFRPGVISRLGIGYTTLNRINPTIISCSLTGFGKTGPYRGRPAYDIVVQAMSSGMSLTGNPPPARSGLSIGDLCGGMWAAHGVLAALFARERNGVGQKVEASLLEGQVALLGANVVEYFLTGKNPTPQSERGNALYRAYKTKDGHIVIAALLEKFWQGLCRALDCEELVNDPRFSSIDQRERHAAALIALLEEILATRTSREWIDRLVTCDVPCSEVNTVAQIVADEQVLHREMVVSVPSPQGGAVKLAGSA